MPVYPKAINLGQTKNVSPNPFVRGEPQFLIMHYTAGWTGAAQLLFGPNDPPRSAHFNITRKGEVYQISDTKRVTWHAGKSFWRGISMLNPHSIGIEHENWGYWRPKIKPATAEAARKAGWVESQHKFYKGHGPTQLWEPYPEEQILASLELSAWILKTHPTIIDIRGHDDIAPGRKMDPGPAFPLERFRDLLHPLDQEKVHDKDMYKVNATTLNVRGGQGTNFEKIGELKSGDEVIVLQDAGEWSYIQNTKDGKQGWVYDQFLTPAA
jgi:N-acetylmuramoyl-L-alanine amidase